MTTLMVSDKHTYSVNVGGGDMKGLGGGGGGEERERRMFFR